MTIGRTLAATLIASLVVVPAQAARPIVDLHKFDAYFALFAADSNVPWKPATVRLDTYSNAPVAISVYRANPADVLTTDASARSRAIDTRRAHRVAHFTFTPPGGYQFQPNSVTLPLGNAEGFFVVEARRGRVGEQVWINRTSVALLAKQTPSELFVHGVDLRTGEPVAHMRVQLLVGDRFVTRYTQRDGSITWSADERPDLALAQWGGSFAFLNLLPEAPAPSTIVGVRTASAVVHAGDTIRVVGFARTRRGARLVPSTGVADLTVRQGARVIVQRRVAVDRSGAFAADLDVPADAAAGDVAVLAEIDGGVGSASVHVDAGAQGLTLDVAAACAESCNPNDDVPVFIRASRPETTVRVSVVRSPHVYVGYAPESTPWGTTTWFDERVTTDESGHAEIHIPRPTDGLSSTYGVRVESEGATADTRIVVPTAPVALRVQLDDEQEQYGSPVAFDVYAKYVGNKRPASGHVVVALLHGGSLHEQTLALDAAGHARGTFSNADLGTNLVTATLDDGAERAEDATQLEVVAQAAQSEQEENSADVAISLDRDAYEPGEPVVATVAAPGAAGDALFTVEGPFGVEAVLAHVEDGRATATLHAPAQSGALSVGAMLVRDGAIEWNALPLVVRAGGRAEITELHVAPAPRPGGDVTISLQGVEEGGTVAVRLTAGDPSGSALFTSAPELFEFGASTTQTSAPQGATWHPWVDSTGSHPLVLGFVRRTEPPPDLTIEQADTAALSWSVTHADGGTVPLHVPSQPGRYTLSVLDIADDGRVIVASSTLDVP